MAKKNVFIELTELISVDKDVLRAAVVTHQPTITFYARSVETLCVELLDDLLNAAEVDQEPCVRRAIYDIPHRRLACLVDSPDDDCVYVHNGDSWSLLHSQVHTTVSTRQRLGPPYSDTRLMTLLDNTDLDDLVGFGSTEHSADIPLFTGRAKRRRRR